MMNGFLKTNFICCMWNNCMGKKIKGLLNLGFHSWRVFSYRNQRLKLATIQLEKNFCTSGGTEEGTKLCLGLEMSGTRDLVLT